MPPTWRELRASGVAVTEAPDPLRDQICTEAQSFAGLELLPCPAFVEPAVQLRWQLENATCTSALGRRCDDDRAAAGKTTELLGALFPTETPIPAMRWWTIRPSVRKDRWSFHCRACLVQRGGRNPREDQSAAGRHDRDGEQAGPSPRRGRNHQLGPAAPQEPALVRANPPR